MKTRGILAISVAIISTIGIAYRAMLGSSQALNILIGIVSIVLGAYFGLEGGIQGVKGIEKVSSKGFMEQEVAGVSVRAILALVIGIGVTSVIAYLAIFQSVGSAVTALIGWDNLVLSYYFTTEATKPSS